MTHPYKFFRKEEKQKDRAMRNLGIVAQRCLYWWRFLPPRTRAWYDIDDMIGEVVLTVTLGAKKFDKSKAKESTWVHHVADNKCKSILKRHGAQLRCDTDTVDIYDLLRLLDCEQITPQGVRKLRKVTKNLTIEVESTTTKDAIDAVEDVIRQGSERTRDLLSRLLQGNVNMRGLQDNPVVVELLPILKQCSITLRDLTLVLNYAVGE